MREDEQIVYLQTGSNQGYRQRNLTLANQYIEEKIGPITKASGLYETEAWGVTDQPDFINQVIEVRTTLEPEAILEAIETIENKLGRIKTRHWGERIIDIDILLYGDLVMNTERLTIPHREMQNRNFVLIPLLEIAGEIEHPVLHETIERLYWQCKDPLEVIKL